jgi:K+-transporting ATPase A subunit
LYVGHGLYKANSNTSWSNPTEIPNQVAALRSYKNTMGSIFFSSKQLEQNVKGWADSLRNNYYSLPAIVPPMNWIDSIAPEAPSIKRLGKQSFTITFIGKDKIKGFGIFTLPTSKQVTVSNATLVKIITTPQSARFDMTEIMPKENERIFVGSICINNNVSKLVELK